MFYGEFFLFSQSAITLGMIGLDNRPVLLCAKWSNSVYLLKPTGIINAKSISKIVSPFYGMKDFQFAYANA